MARHSDAELLRVVESPEGTYRAEALEAARAEMAKRNLTARPTAVIAEQRSTVAASRATEPLGLMWILVTLFLPGTCLLALLLASRFERDGYRRKATALRTLALVVIGFYTAMFALALASRR